MAYIGSDADLATWVAGPVGDDLLAEACISLLRSDTGAEEPTGEVSQGFIIQDWFGPFLLGPSSSFLRGRC